MYDFLVFHEEIIINRIYFLPDGGIPDAGIPNAVFSRCLFLTDGREIATKFCIKIISIISNTPVLEQLFA